MTGKVLILGGYGNFGKRIAAGLVRHHIPVIIAGRDRAKANTLVNQLATPFAEGAAFDMACDLDAQLRLLKPDVVINCCGPFQEGNYDAARLCIAHHIHYIDLADGRNFVTGISALHEEALRQGVTVISGASTVPGLSSAVVEKYRDEFASIDTMTYGISPGQKTERGLATVKAILSYVGKPLAPFAGGQKPVYGWQDNYRQAYPHLGPRWMANCDISDLDLFPARYAIRSIHFSAGMELGIMHLAISLLSWMVRLKLLKDLHCYAENLLRFSNYLNRFGTNEGGMHVILEGTEPNGKAYRRSWYIIARDGDGPQIPCVPAVLLAKRLAQGERVKAGAYACAGLITLEDYLKELQRFAIVTVEG